MPFTNCAGSTAHIGHPGTESHLGSSAIAVKLKNYSNKSCELNWRQRTWTHFGSIVSFCFNTQLWMCPSQVRVVHLCVVPVSFPHCDEIKCLMSNSVCRSKERRYQQCNYPTNCRLHWADASVRRCVPLVTNGSHKFGPALWEGGCFRKQDIRKQFFVKFHSAETSRKGLRDKTKHLRGMELWTADLKKK